MSDPIPCSQDKPKPPKHLGILRLSAIGDIVNLIPTLIEIHKQLPQTTITLIVGKPEAPLLQHLDFLELIIYDKSSGWKGMLELWKQLKFRVFDVFLHMQTSLRSSILSTGIKAVTKIGYSKERAFNKQNWFVDRCLETQSSVHIVDSYLDFLSALGLQRPIVPRWEIPLNQDDLTFAQDYIHPEMFTMVLSPSSSQARKNWTLANYIDLCEWAVAQGWSVLVTGSPAAHEMELAQAIEDEVPEVVNIAGKTSLPQLCAILKSADLVISPDSGPLHIANQMGTTIIGLYAYNDPRNFGPYFHLDKVVSVYDDYKPAGKLKWGYRNHQENLMQHISLEMVITKIDQVLQLDSH